jgi:RNase P subunit RPR2
MEFAIIVCHLWSFERQPIIGTRIAEPMIMKFFCKHCDQIVIGKPYRVISEDNGVILLNMTVCGSCHEQAKALGLHSEAIQRDPYGRDKSLSFRSPARSRDKRHRQTRFLTDAPYGSL